LSDELIEFSKGEYLGTDVFSVVMIGNSDMDISA
jgi:hypothetical protein